jgi:hypothetical protein
MAQPTLSHTGQRLYDALAPLATEDEAHGWPLAHYCNALARQLDQVADLSRDVGDAPGWAVLMDPDATPAEMLPWLAQLIGVTIPDGLTEAEARVRVKQTDGFRRGTPEALKGAARQYLIGPDGTPETATVHLIERHGGRWKITVTTLADETPDAGRVLAACMEQKAAGLVLTHSVIPGGDWQTLRDTHPDWADVAATFTDYQAAREDPAQQ